MTEQILIEGCIKNDALSQRELYNKYSSKMLGICYRFAYNKNDAQDILQEGFIKIFSQIHTFQNKGSFEGWVRRIIVNSCINYIKKNKKYSDNLDLAYAANIHAKQDSLSTILLAKQVVECIRLLPIGFRTVLNLYAIEGYSHKEIAEMLEIQESTSRSQYTRAKGILESILIKKGIISSSKDELNWIANLK